MFNYFAKVLWKCLCEKIKIKILLMNSKKFQSNSRLKIMSILFLDGLIRSFRDKTI